MMMDELLDLDNPNLTHFTTQRRSFPFLSCTMAADIEDSSPVSEKTGRGEIPSDFVRAGVTLQSYDSQPGPQRTFGVGMTLPEFLKSLTGDYVHRRSLGNLLHVPNLGIFRPNVKGSFSNVRIEI